MVPTQPAKTSGSKVRIWVLVIVGVLVVIGAVVTVAVVMGLSLGHVAPTIKTNPNLASNMAVPSNTSAPTSGVETYLTNATVVMQDLSNAVDKWNTAADKGSGGDLTGSTAALNDGLSAVKNAEAALSKLTPDSQTTKFHDLLRQAVAKAREAMEQGILGNSSNQGASALTKSSAAIQNVLTLFDQLAAELQSLSQGLPNRAV